MSKKYNNVMAEVILSREENKMEDLKINKV